jgi:hypothetical protein
MRSRLRNRTRYRGGEPIRLTEGGIAPVLPGPGRGRSLKGAEDNLNRIARAFAAVAAYEGIASAMNLIDDILPWAVLLLGLSLPLLAVWLLG